MKLLIKQKIFTIPASYDVYNEEGNIKYYVKAKMFSFGRVIDVFNSYQEEIATIKQKALSFLPKFDLFVSDNHVGSLVKEFSYKPRYTLDSKGWVVKGNFMSWEYDVIKDDLTIMHITKEIFRIGDTYVLNIINDEDEILCLLIAIAIDAANRSRSR